MKQVLIHSFEKDFNRLIDEINLFREEENLWKTTGSIKNSSGNLILHLVGGTNYLVGAMLGDTGYVRNRDAEFTQKNIDKIILVKQVKDLIETIKNTLTDFSEEALNTSYPMSFDGATRSVGYVLIQLHSHLNYHLGQINYLRRSLE